MSLGGLWVVRFLREGGGFEYFEYFVCLLLMVIVDVDYWGVFLGLVWGYL